MADDHYQLVSIQDGKSDADAIVQTLSAMQEGRLKPDLVLLNYCSEIPVSYSATVQAVDKDSVELAVHEHQAVLLKQNNSTLLKSRHFDKGLAVHCYAAYVNIPKKAAILHNFAYAQIRAERREAVRVKVNGVIPVSFTVDGVTISGRLLDISASGISFVADSPMPATVEGTGQFVFTLLDTPLTVPGVFVRVKTDAENRQIAIFTMTPDRASDTVIGKYIYQRQVEVILALKEGLFAG